nr:uncharacterized protein LOC104102165 [Nicotiana tomentosiformis]
MGLGGAQTISIDPTASPHAEDRRAVIPVPGSIGDSVFLKEEFAKSAIALSEKLYFLTVDDTVKTGNDDGLTMKTKTERIHMYPEELTCTFNFKSMGRALLAKENPLCKADKLEYRI